MFLSGRLKDCDSGVGDYYAVSTSMNCDGGVVTFYFVMC